MFYNKAWALKKDAYLTKNLIIFHASNKNWIIINKIIKTKHTFHIKCCCPAKDATLQSVAAVEQYSSVVLHIVILYHACLDHDGNMQQILHLDIITMNTIAQTCKDMGSMIFNHLLI